MDFAVLVDHKVKMKRIEKERKIFGPSQRATKRCGTYRLQ